MKKKSIYYSRTYRHLNFDRWQNIVFLVILIGVSLTLFIMNMNNITGFISRIAAELLGKIFVGRPIYIVSNEFSILGNMQMIDLPTVYPTLQFTVINFLVVLVLVLFLASGKRRGKPLSIYATLGLLVHMINCIYFIFASNHFPYTAYIYSDLYMKQQIGIWVTFIVLTAMVVVLIGNKGIMYKLLAFISIMAYSFVFGAVRYVVFLYIIEQFSILYMAPMFFVFGPFFDFLYMVAIYGVFINKMVKLYDSEKGREEWQW